MFALNVRNSKDLFMFSVLCIRSFSCTFKYHLALSKTDEDTINFHLKVAVYGEALLYQ